jgi:plasmid stability protein
MLSILPLEAIGSAVTRNFYIRNICEDLVDRLKRLADRQGRSAEADHRETLRQDLRAEAEGSFEELAAKFRALTAGGKHTSSEILQREGREER